MLNILKSIAVAALALLLAFAAPAMAKRLTGIPITTAVTAQVTAPIQIVPKAPLNAMNIQARLAYGSGGTTVAAWVQTSLDGGTSWFDVASFAFTTASSTVIMNVSAATPKLTPIVLTDGALAPNTAIDGLVGTQWRLKYTTTGTYAGGTTLQVDINGAQFTSSP